jgi:hypothetical protein
MPADGVMPSALARADRTMHQVLFILHAGKANARPHTIAYDFKGFP